MLIEFSVTNFRSFRKCQTFSLAKATGGGLLENTFSAEDVNKFHLLRSATIYGPNAGGKSNFLLALNVMRTIVLESATDMLPVAPFFLFNDSTRRAPSEFEMSFIVNKVRYQYGLSATIDRIYEEWLFAFPKGRQQRWFERTWNKRSRDYDWYLGNNLTGKKDLWKESTRDNALFLSTAAQLNSKQLQPIRDWFTRMRILIDSPEMDRLKWGLGFSASLCEESNEKQGKQIVEFLSKADLGISRIDIEKKLPDDELPDNMPKSTHKKWKKKKRLDIYAIHEDAKGMPVGFPFEAESQGTHQMFGFAGPWIDSLDKGNILCIDELNNSLHPLLVQFLVQLFHSNETNPNNAQLIFTTHDTSILNQDVFRRDQIWFCEKGEDQATTLYPLTDFSPRKSQNLELAYLSGRYGALPYVR